LVVGSLTGHGRALYQHRADQDLSYYVTLLTSKGPRTLWGKDLERAVREGERGQQRPALGDLVGARRVSRRPVAVIERRRDAVGRVVQEFERRGYRTRWQVENVKFFAQRARLAHQVRDEHSDVRSAIREHPELKSTFLSVRAAEEFAARRIAEPADRARFLELVRGAMAGSIHRGEPLPAVRLRDAPKASARPAVRPADRKRDDPTR
jgi:hypothetical protein